LRVGERFPEGWEDLDLLVHSALVPDEMADGGLRFPARIAGLDENGALETRLGYGGFPEGHAKIVVQNPRQLNLYP
jgi:hypothetical protein